jgi:hypothetical protein
MEATCFTETSVYFQRTSRCYISVDETVLALERPRYLRPILTKTEICLEILAETLHHISIKLNKK